MRLIDADVFRGKVCGWFHKDIQESNQVDDLAASVVMEIDNAPTVEAAPVVHGRWERVTDGYYACTHCKETTCIISGSRNYCPNCAAKMDL